MGLVIPTDFTGFKDVHKGETIWVCASGASMNNIPRWFWSDRIVVAVNFVGVVAQIPDFYAVTHYHIDAEKIAEQRPDVPVITPKVDQGGNRLLGRRPQGDKIYFADTGAQAYSQFDCAELWPKKPDTLVVGPTSLHMTMHFAQYLGARHIILAGADCGHLDGASNMDGYSPGDNPLGVWNKTLRTVAGQLRSEGVSVMSLNPFVNFALEGHTFEGPTVRIN